MTISDSPLAAAQRTESGWRTIAEAICHGQEGIPAERWTFRGAEAAAHLCKAFKTGTSLSGSHLMRMRPKMESKRSTRGARPGPSRQDLDHHSHRAS